MARQRKGQSIEERITEALRDKNGMRIMDLAKRLEMYDSNLRKRIKVLIQKGIAERYLQDGYTCVRLKRKV